MKNEIYYAICGVNILGFFIGKIVKDSFREGTPGTVDMNVSQSLSFGRRLLGFYHTHPNTRAYPSQTDDATMKSWIVSTGRPLLCAIDGTDGLHCYSYYNWQGEFQPKKIWRIGSFIFGA